MTLSKLGEGAAAAVDLRGVAFSEAERVIFRAGPLSAAAFRFVSGVDAVRLSNGHDEVVVLPFQGQHVWSARLGGRDVGMKSMFDMPRPTQKFFETYGGYFQHAGITAIGAPGPMERREQHGELPNAPYRDAAVLLGEDASGRYIAVTGRYNHTVAFATNYEAVPLLKLYEGRSRISIGITVTNLKSSPLTVHYLGHLNWRAREGGRLLGTVHETAESLRVRQEIPPHIKPGPGYVEWIAELAKDPSRAGILTSDKIFAPEVVFAFDPLTDDEGRSHFMQVHPDGTADYTSFKPEDTGAAARWICRTGDQEAVGMAFPVRSPDEAARVNGQEVTHAPLAQGERFTTEIIAAVFTPAEAEAMARHIEAVKRLRA